MVIGPTARLFQTGEERVEDMIHLLAPDSLHRFSAQRQRCGTAGKGLTERSERRGVPAVATTVLFSILILFGVTCR